MFDLSSCESVFLAHVERETAGARADVAAAAADELRQQLNHMETEAMVASAIAADVFRLLHGADRDRAEEVREVLLSRYSRYRHDFSFPYLRELLTGLPREEALCLNERSAE